MTDQHAALDAALERVVVAARAHLEAVKAAKGQPDDEGVWAAYVALSNASFDYDGLLLDVFDEVTPWNVADPAEADREFGVAADAVDGEGDDPYPAVLSVRQRRDYRVPSVTALLAVAEQARSAAAQADGTEPVETPVESISEAVLELLQAGDGSLAALDVPELEPLDGIVVVAEVDDPLDLDSFEDADGAGPFSLDETDRLVGRLDEHPYSRADALADDEDIDEEDAGDGPRDPLG